MDIQVHRLTLTGTSTIGEMIVDGKFECYTLEDPVRAPGVKVPGDTAIPAGTYQVIIDDSARFGRPMPHILNVPGFVGIRIHCGNTSEDTEGCILVGTHKGSNEIDHCRPAFERFFTALEDAGSAWITIS